MKKIFAIIYILAIVSPILSQKKYSSVQDTFFKCTFEDSEFNCKNTLQDNGYDVKVRNSYMSIYNIVFGGYSWKCAYLYFYDDMFFEISFINNYKEKSVAISKYSQLKYEMNKKYEMNEYISQTSKLPHCYYIDSLGNAAGIELSYDVSKGGSYYYFVTLSYRNMELFKKNRKKETDEL